MRRRMSVDSRQDLPAEEMRHVKPLQGYFLLLTRNSPRLDADTNGFCRAVLRCKGRLALILRGRREGLGDGSRQWSDDSDCCGSQNGALGQDGAPIVLFAFRNEYLFGVSSPAPRHSLSAHMNAWRSPPEARRSPLAFDNPIHIGQRPWGTQLLVFKQNCSGAL